MSWEFGGNNTLQTSNLKRQHMLPIPTINAFFQAIIDKNAVKIGSFYVQDEATYVVLEGPRLTTLGFEKIQKGWFDFCDSRLTLDKIEWLEGPFSEAEPRMAWVGGVIKLTVSVGGEKSFEQTFRASFVVKKSDEKSPWRIRHEHVSGALADPYGIGDWLKVKADEGT
jgi:ketosteroid isomerase-like protein